MPDIGPKDLKPLFRNVYGRYQRRCTLEIGANSGVDTLMLLSLDRFADIHCFEPEPRAIKRWRKNVRNKRAILHEIALSNETGTATFHPSGGYPGGQWANYGDWDMSGSLLPFDRHQENSPWMEPREPYTVQTITLDEWAAANLPSRYVVQFAWVDVQGAEALVLQGAQETLKRICYWYCECDPRPNYHNQATKEELVALLSGFELVKEFPGFNLLFRNLSIT
jgi:FkbM family methyltransferase